MHTAHIFGSRAIFLGLTGLLVLVLGCAPTAQQPAAGTSSGGEQQPKHGGDLVLLMNQAGDPPSFDLHQESTSAVTESTGPLYDNLVRFDPMDSKDSIVLPDLAEKWTVSPDGMSYTFNLRKGVKFHNGNPFTSADVKFTLDRIMNPPKGIKSPRQTAFEPITSIETPDDYTVVVKTSRPYASLLVNLAQGWMAMYDQEWIKAKGDDIPTKEMMGTGPFLLDKYTRGTEIVRKRNPEYWNQPRPYLDSVRHLIVPDPNTRVAALRTGQVHSLGLNANDFEKFKQEMDDKMRFETGGSLGFGSLYMNTKKKPFDDARVREALYLSVNRHSAVEIVNQGEGMLGGYMMPSGPWSLPEEEILKLPGYGKDKTQDIERAKKLLSDAGYPNGFTAEIRTRNSQSYLDLSIFIIDQLKKIGVTAAVKPYETAQAYDLAEKGDYELLTWSHGFALDDPDAVYNEFYLCNAPRNWARLCSPEVDDLYKKQSQELDPKKRTELMMQLEKTAVPLAGKIVTSWGMGRTAKWNFVKDYVRHNSGYNNIRFDGVWMDK